MHRFSFSLKIKRFSKKNETLLDKRRKKKMKTTEIEILLQTLNMQEIYKKRISIF